MPAGTSKPRPVRWASAEFLATLDAVYKRRGTSLGAAMNEHGLFDIERYGTPEEIALAREHMAARGRPGPKPQDPTPKPAPAPLTPAEELKQWAERRNEGLITEEEFAAKKKQLLDL